jgi:hypothetical protein
MSTGAQLLVLGVAVVAFLVIVWLVRRGSLKERFALLWLGIGGMLFLLVAIRPLLDRLSEELGIESGTTTLFLAAILFLLGLILHLSVIISGLEEKVRDLAEAVALAEVDASADSVPAVAPPDDRQDEA